MAGIDCSGMVPLVKARLRIILSLLYVLALASHGLEHRAAADGHADAAPEADSSACGACAFLAYAGQTIGTPTRGTVPEIRESFGLPDATVAFGLVVFSRPLLGPLGARAPPHAA